MKPDLQIDEINLRVEPARCECIAPTELVEGEGWCILKLHVDPELDLGEAQNLSIKIAPSGRERHENRVILSKTDTL